jgi:hypothetical protein
MSVFGVGAPHVSGGGISDGLSGYLILLCGICADELSFFSEKGWVVRQWTGSVKAVAGSSQAGWGDGNSFRVAMWLVESRRDW